MRIWLDCICDHLAAEGFSLDEGKTFLCREHFLEAVEKLKEATTRENAKSKKVWFTTAEIVKSMEGRYETLTRLTINSKERWLSSERAGELADQLEEWVAPAFGLNAEGRNHVAEVIRVLRGADK